MNEIVSFKKEIDFNTMIDKITSIEIEHTLMSDNNSNIKGELIISGTYRETEASQIDSPFSYKIPVDIEVDSKYDISNMTIDIDDFTYDVIDNKLIIDVSLILDKLELKKIDENLDDEIINMNDLFLEKNIINNEEIIKEKVEKNNNNNVSNEKIEEKIEVNNMDEDNINRSLFSNLDSTNETYKTYSVYILRENDSIDEIITKYKITREKLEEYNDLNNLKNGSKIIIPDYE